MKFHISDDGTARECRAKPGNCKLKQSESEHYSSKNEAQIAYESKNNNLSQNINMRTAKECLNIHLSNIGNNNYDDIRIQFQQTELMKYYNKKFGLTAQQYYGTNEKLNTPKDTQTNSIKGEQYITTDRTENSQKWLTTGVFDKAKHVWDNETKTNIEYLLISQSYNWAKKLSLKEQALVTFNTGSESQYLGEATDGKLSCYADHGEKELLKIAKDLKKIMQKAPQLERFYTTYRGTTPQELNSFFDEMNHMEVGTEDFPTDENGEVKYDEHYETNTPEIQNFHKELLSGKYNDRILSKNSRIQKIPQSTSLNPALASEFGNSIMLQIRQKTFASASNMTARGTREYEVFTNPHSRYKIIKTYQAKVEKGSTPRIVVCLEEIMG